MDAELNGKIRLWEGDMKWRPSAGLWVIKINSETNIASQSVEVMYEWFRNRFPEATPNPNGCSDSTLMPHAEQLRPSQATNAYGCLSANKNPGLVSIGRNGT